MIYLAALLELHSSSPPQAMLMAMGMLLCVIGVALIKMLAILCDALRGTHGMMNEDMGCVVQEVIQIDSSPEPTRLPCSPFWQPTPTPKRRPARRGGHRRFVSHARWCTRDMNPRLPHHCAYQCLLRAACAPTKLENVNKLRENTATLLQNAYLEDNDIHGVPTRQVISLSGQTLKAYLADVRFQQWASSLEVAAAADILGIHVMIDNGYDKIVTGTAPTHVVKLAKSHWTLAKIHKRKIMQTTGTTCHSRGGMWTWEEPTPQQPIPEDEEIPDWARLGHQQTLPAVPIGPQALPHVLPQRDDGDLPSAPSTLGHEAHTVSVPALLQRGDLQQGAGDMYSKSVKIAIDSSVDTNIRELLIQVKCGVPLGVLLDQISEIVKVDRKKLALVPTSASRTPLSIWDPCPDVAHLVDILTMPTPMGRTLHVQMPPTDIEFTMCLDGRWSLDDVMHRLAILLATNMSDVSLVDSKGYPWTLPPADGNYHARVITKSSRGGMYGNTVSTTLPMEDQPWGGEIGDNTVPVIPEVVENPDVPADAYDSDDNYDPAHERDMEDWHREEILREPPSTHRPEASRSRSPPRQRRPTPMEQYNQPVIDDADPAIHDETYAYWSGVWPVSPPSAQPERIAKPVYVEGRVLGHIYAAPGADVTEVLDEFVLRVRPESLIDIRPIQAIQWQHVASLAIDPPVQPPVTVQNTYDRRETCWEKLQKIRMVPVIIHGEVIETLLLPGTFPFRGPSIE